MPWTYKFVPDDVGSSTGMATVTFTDDAVFGELQEPFVYSHRVALDGKVDDVSRLKAEIEGARDKEIARRSVLVTDSISLATLLALE